MYLTRAPKYMKQKFKEFKGQGNILTIILGDFNTSLSIMEKIRQKIKNLQDLNNVINQLDLKNFYRIAYPTTIEYIFTLSAHGLFFKIDHILGHNTNLNKFQS